jgi:AcrR family transcriptional regulator
MNQLFTKMSIPLNEHLYLKDPVSSELGVKIVNGSILLISKLGFEKFTLKKLAEEIETTEASIYRYFESKQKVILYLINWYWSCISFRIYMGTQNMSDPKERLKKCIHILTAIPNPANEFVLENELELKFLVINESSKVFLTKNVDDENKLGVFSEYKKVVEYVSSIVSEINPNYPYPNMLVSNMMEGSNQQRFFGAHLPRLTNQDSKEDLVEPFFMDLILKAISND